MKKDFNKLVKALDEDELRDELRMLYDRFAVVREYYKLELGGTTKPVLDKYKADLRKCFFSGRRRVARRARSESKKVIKAFAQVSIHPRDLAELHFYRAEVMTDAIAHYRIENDSYSEATVKAFAEALAFAQREALLTSLRPQIERLATYHKEHQHYGSYSFWPVFRQFYPE